MSEARTYNRVVIHQRDGNHDVYHLAKSNSQKCNIFIVRWLRLVARSITDRQSWSFRWARLGWSTTFLLWDEQ
ncbi:Uncharacterised protein [Vibrio cholerae]|nr:Uncharacterised protein [Vibrio cholerae]